MEAETRWVQELLGLQQQVQREAHLTKIPAIEDHPRTLEAMPLRVEMLTIIHLAPQTISTQEIGLVIGIGREIASTLTREMTRLKGQVSTITLGIVTMVVVAQI